MMELKNIMKLLGGLGIPIAYHHFAEGESPEPPFLIYLTPGSHNFSADGMVYFKVKQLDVELYTDKKDLALEEKLEKILEKYPIKLPKNLSGWVLNFWVALLYMPTCRPLAWSWITPPIAIVTPPCAADGYNARLAEGGTCLWISSRAP